MADDPRDPRPPLPPKDFPGETFDVPPPAHRLQLAPPVAPVSKGLKNTASDPSVPWDDMRRLYVQGIATGPGFPDRTDVLARVGEAGTLLRENGRHGGRHNIVTVGDYKIVLPTIHGVARYFGVGSRTVAERATAEDWHGLQQLYRIQLRQKNGQAKTRKRLERVELIDRRAHATAALGLRMVHERLQLLSQTMEVVDGEVRIMVDPREMDSLARAAQVWHALGRRALGFPVELVGSMKAIDAAEMADFGLVPTQGIEEEVETPVEEIGPGHRFDGGFIAAVGDGLVDDKPSVSTELARDDTERLHGFLTVLGRTQQASEGESGDGDAQDGELGAMQQREIGTGTEDG